MSAIAIRTAVTAAVLCASAVAPVAGQDATVLLADKNMTVGAGATISAAVGEAVARVEHAFVPSRLFEERGIARRAANITYRLLRFSYFDAPQEQWLLVASHEVFGHGARLRERFDGPITYRLRAPPPYGRGGGSISFRFDRDPTVFELQAVAVGGMEANAVAASLIATRAVADGRIRWRDALRYLGFELDAFGYIQGTGDEPERPGHDVSDFIQTYNEVAEALDASLLRPSTVRREALAGLANPMLAYAAIGIGRFLWNGASDTPVWVLSIGGVRYLPLVRYRLTPYGTEWALVNELGGRLPPMFIEVRVGRAHRSAPWGVSVRHRDIATWRAWRVDARVELWRQPSEAHLENGRLRPTVGAAVYGRAERPLLPVWFSPERAPVIVDIGLKSAGFVPGEPLRGGVVVRAGLGLPLWSPSSGLHRSYRQSRR